MATETFRYPRRFKVMTAFSAVVFAALAAILLKWFEIAPLRQPELFISIMLTLGASVTWCVAMYKRANDEVMVDESTIVYRAPGQTPVILAWGDVRRVRARDVLQRLELADAAGGRRVIAAYQMDNFARLRQIVRERTSPPVVAGRPQRVFTKSVGALVLGLHWTLLVVLVWLWLWWNDAQPGYAWVGVAIAWGVWTIVSAPWRVRLLDDVVVVDWIGRCRRIRYADIQAVRVTDVKGVKSIDPETTGGVATVTIDVVDGRPVALSNFKDGSLSLYRALDDAHRRGGPPR